MGATAILSRWSVVVLAGAALLACSPHVRRRPRPTSTGRSTAATQGGQRYSTAAQITPANVAALTVAWTYSTGDVASKGAALKRLAFENTPILAGGRLYVCSPFNEVSRAGSGDRQGPLAVRSEDRRAGPLSQRLQLPRRGLLARPGAAGRSALRRAHLHEHERPAAVRARRGDRQGLSRLRRERRGRRCGGRASLTATARCRSPRRRWWRAASSSSAPRSTTTSGSSEVSGAVRAYDARHRRAALELRSAREAPSRRSVAGAANVWAPMSVDEARGLVFLPTTSPEPRLLGRDAPRRRRRRRLGRGAERRDRRGGLGVQDRPSRRVGLRQSGAADAGRRRPGRGRREPAVLQPTKQGLLFTLDRDTGGRSSRSTSGRSRRAAPRARCSRRPSRSRSRRAPLAPSRIEPEDAFGCYAAGSATPTASGRSPARATRASYTPPSLAGHDPLSVHRRRHRTGAASPSIRPRQIVYVNTSSAMHLVTLIPAAQVAARAGGGAERRDLAAGRRALRHAPRR